MGYVELCKKHGQYHGEFCGECFEDLKAENIKLQSENQRLKATLSSLNGSLLEILIHAEGSLASVELLNCPLNEEE